MHAPILVVGVRIPRADGEGRRHRGHGHAARGGDGARVSWRDGRCCRRGRPSMVNCVVVNVTLSPAAADSSSATVSVVVIVIPVRVVVVMMPFSSSLSTGGVSLVMVAYLRSIDVEILSWFKPQVATYLGRSEFHKATGAGPRLARHSVRTETCCISQLCTNANREYAEL